MPIKDAAIVKAIISTLKVRRLEGRLNVVSKSLQNEVRRRFGSGKATVWTVFPLEKTELFRIKKILDRVTGGEVEIENKLNPQIIGGLKIEAGDLLIDASLQGEFNRLKTLVQ